ncbi:hypothetical protein [Pantoea sp. At-9b]|uniref:hypothetical protein n=1 Tax=Pantoea sp. (strain At-9b) TaxID=592316 RepID=UPI0001B40210|nr:hypothetical protein [Pantoea sp. At-9b]ADU72663.1 conserved hypothetical protein [Pantoea sp. At-9b]
MKIYWTLRSIPELSQLSSKECGKRWNDIYTSTFRHWETWTGLLLCALLSGAGVKLFGFPGVIAMGAIGGFVYGQIVIHVARKYYRQRLLGEPG